MANDEYRAPLETARQLGLEVRNAVRRERAIRRAVAEEIALKLDGLAADPHGTNGEQASWAFSMAAGIAREIGTREGTDG
jgi:hypothetical protein